eukprot:8322782-Alexandrium_andersonii.AAC.1
MSVSARATGRRPQWRGRCAAMARLALPHRAGLAGAPPHSGPFECAQARSPWLPLGCFCCMFRVACEPAYTPNGQGGPTQKRLAQAHSEPSLKLIIGAGAPVVCQRARPNAEAPVGRHSVHRPWRRRYAAMT